MQALMSNLDIRVTQCLLFEVDGEHELAATEQARTLKLRDGAVGGVAVGLTVEEISHGS